jgi:hypothetical protein
MTERTKDRHKNKKCRNKPGYIRPSRRNPEAPDTPRKRGRPAGPPKPPKEPKPFKTPKPKGWHGKFVSVDGEGWDGKYTLLACSAHTYDLYNPDGLPTRACLRYLTDWGVKGGDALVGFGLSYDFENILKDVPDDDYKKLLNNESIQFHEFTLKYIPRKILEIKKDLDKKDDKGKPRFKTVFLQDTLGYFQTSFEKALKKFNIEVPPIITEGKALRGDFHKAPLDFIKRYNREELRLHQEMMEIIRVSGKEAFEAIGLEAQATPRTWFGPGAWASSFLKQTDWLGEHPDFRGQAFETLQEEMTDYNSPYVKDDFDRENLNNHPFAAAFYGGRIEAAAVGEFLGKAYDYDVNSAYPFALANFPKWEPEDLIRVESFDLQQRIGMYFVEWNCPKGAGFYPFPYRSQTGNVFYPPKGKGWYMTPEIFAALEVWGPECIKVKQGYVLEGTDGCGDGLHKLPADKLCTTAKKMDLMAIIRLKAKAEGLSMEKALKLLMNSCYGKTVQQVGSHKYLNLFAASWITGTCRAIISRTIGKDLDNSTISVMTDGILTRKPLDVNLGKALGEFELTEFDKVIQFMPGVYYLENFKTGKIESKYRGMDKNFEPEKAKSILWEEAKKYLDPVTKQEIKEGYYPVNINVFVTRNLALHQPNKYDSERFKFMPVQKMEEFSLRSKRLPGKKGFRLLKKEQNKFFNPKTANPLELLVAGSKPYVLDLPREDDYDGADEEDEMMAEQRMSTLLETEAYDLI